MMIVCRFIFVVVIMNKNKFLYSESFNDYSFVIRDIQLGLISRNISFRTFSEFVQIDPSNLSRIFSLKVIPSAVEYFRIINVYQYVLSSDQNI